MTRRRIVIPSLCVLLLWGLNHLALGLAGDPLDGVRAHATSLGLQAEQLQLLDGGYHTDLLGLTAHGTFSVTDGDRRSKLYVEVSRRSLLLGWTLETYAETPAEAETPAAAVDPEQT